MKPVQVNGAETDGVTISEMLKVMTQGDPSISLTAQRRRNRAVAVKDVRQALGAPVHLARADCDTHGLRRQRRAAWQAAT